MRVGIYASCTRVHARILGGVQVLYKQVFLNSGPPPLNKQNIYIILEWRFVQICVIYRIKFKLPKQKIPCPGLIYQAIQGCIQLIVLYMAFDQRVK